MLLDTRPQNDAVLSNVGSTGEFKIKNSPKAFQILSAGLYADKILAIVRELSCNAKDSHVAAGCKDRPFEVHLPTALEPWFSIRDFGTGLTNDQVVNIYTTYFESTKTGSNDFIGALGLGSKTPFSYTTNFTVVAIKDGTKGVYTAYINDNGVPSIASMCEEASTDEPGVEIKFPVEDLWDFSKFATAAGKVYRYFEVLPIFTGSQPDISRPVYETENIIPGVSLFKRDHGSIAVMGNIAYPILIPNSTPEDAALLKMGLELRFEIGELDIQASREGLSYIPSTVEAITKRLSQLRSVLYSRLASEANSFSNLWERAEYLREKGIFPLWLNAVKRYITETKFPLLVQEYNRFSYLTYEISEDRLANEFNISVDGFVSGSNKIKPWINKVHSATGVTTTLVWSFDLGTKMLFVYNDLKTGAIERAKYHAREKALSGKRIYVLNAVDKTLPMLTDKLFAEMYSPPTSQLMLASALLKKPRVPTQAANATIMKLNYRTYSRACDYTWQDVGRLSSFSDSETFYYLPLTGFAVNSKSQHTVNAKDLAEKLQTCGIKQLTNLMILGVRKKDLPLVKSMKNWINLEDEISARIATIDPSALVSIAVTSEDVSFLLPKVGKLIKRVDSPYLKLISTLSSKSLIADSASIHSIKCIDRLYGTGALTAGISAAVEEVSVVRARYPLLSELRSVRYLDEEAVAEYVNLIDAAK